MGVIKTRLVRALFNLAVIKLIDDSRGVVTKANLKAVNYIVWYAHSNLAPG